MPTDLTPTTLAKPWPTVDKNQLPDRDYGKSENVSGNNNIFTIIIVIKHIHAPILYYNKLYAMHLRRSRMISHKYGAVILYKSVVIRP